MDDHGSILQKMFFTNLKSNVMSHQNFIPKKLSKERRNSYNKLKNRRLSSEVRWLSSNIISHYS